MAAAAVLHTRGLNAASEGIHARVRTEVGDEPFDRYFSGRESLTLRPDGLEIVVASRFVADLVSRRFGEALRRAASTELGSSSASVRFVVRGDGSPAAPALPAAHSPAHAATPATHLHTPSAEPGRHARHVRRQPWASLDDFVVGDANRLAHSAATALAVGIGEGRSAVSRLFVHGLCGLGKTHLLQGIARRAKELNPGANVRYTTGEAFTNEFIAAVRSGPDACEKFRRSYRALDLLCLDDVHFLSSKSATQSELLHTFDAIDLSGARVVLASDAHPRQIRRFAEALVSRFMAGMVVELLPPETSLRERLIRAIASRRGLPIEAAAAKALAELAGPPSQRAASSVRELEGLLTRVEAVWRLVPPEALTGGTITPGIVRQALSPSSGAGLRARRPVRAEQIIQAACDTLEVSREDFTGTGRHRRVVLARAVVAVLCRRMTMLSFPDIARAMGRPNHSTIITAYQRLIAQMEAAVPSGLEGDLADLSLAQLCDRIAAEAAALEPS